jgi:hypothetical protein
LPDWRDASDEVRILLIRTFACALFKGIKEKKNQRITPLPPYLPRAGSTLEGVPATLNWLVERSTILFLLNRIVVK